MTSARILRIAAIAAAFLAGLPAVPQGRPVVFGERAGVYAGLHRLQFAAA